MVEGVTFLTTQFKALGLVKETVENVREFYPDQPFVVVDDGSRDESTDYILALGETDPNAVAVVSSENLGQGAALHLGIQSVRTRYAFTMHTDARLLRGGLVEYCRGRFEEDPDLFALGPHVVDLWGGYVWNYAMMLDLEKYAQVRPFVTTGQPFAVDAMRDAHEMGWGLEAYPDAGEWVHHGGPGSSQRALQEKIDAGEFTREDWERTSRHFKGRFGGQFGD